MISVVVDTNVIVSALLAKREDSPTVKILRAIMGGLLRPLHSPEILDEYREVLSRAEFHFNQSAVDCVIQRFREIGLDLSPAESDGTFPDPDDKVFYCVALAAQDEKAKLVTGNIRHYPQADFVVTPAELCRIASL